MYYDPSRQVFGRAENERDAALTNLLANRIGDAADLYTAKETGTVPARRATYQPSGPARYAGSDGFAERAAQIASIGNSLTRTIGTVRNLFNPQPSPQPSSYEIPSWEQSFNAPPVVPNLPSVAAAPTSFNPAGASTQIPWTFPSSLPGGF